MDTAPGETPAHPANPRIYVNAPLGRPGTATQWPSQGHSALLAPDREVKPPASLDFCLHLADHVLRCLRR